MTAVGIILSYTSCDDKCWVFLIFNSSSSFITASSQRRKDDTQTRTEKAQLPHTIVISQLCQVLATEVRLLIPYCLLLQFNCIWLYLNKKTKVFVLCFSVIWIYGNSLALHQIQTCVTVSVVFMHTTFLSSKSR